MNQIIQAGILILIVLAIVYLLLPLLTGIIHTIAVLVVVIGAIICLMKIGGMWF